MANAKKIMHCSGDIQDNGEEIVALGVDSLSEVSPAPGYGNGPRYWDARYRHDPEPFEWLETFTDLAYLLQDATQRDMTARILNVGCGNSLLTERMYDGGYRSIVNIDTSAVVINQMAERNRTTRPDMTWERMDAGDMSYEDASFDVVIDKSTLDTLACGDDALLRIGTYLSEVERVLRPEGTYLCVSYGPPHTRMRFLQMPHLDMAVKTVEMPARSETPNAHYAYVCKKPKEPSGAATDWRELKQQLLSDH